MQSHYGKESTKCVNLKWYLISKVVIWFITLKVNANQQCTLRMSYRRVDPFSKDLINISIKNTQIASLGNSLFFTIWQE